MRVDIAISPPPPPPQKKEEESCAFCKVILSIYTERCAMSAPIISSGSFFNEPSSRQTQKRQQEAREFFSLQSPNISLGTLPRTHPFDTIPGSREGRQLPCKTQSPRHNTTPPEMCVPNVPSTTNDHLEASRDARTFFINVTRRHPESDIVFWTRLLLKSTSPSGEHLLRCLARTRRRTRDFARRTRCVIIGTHCSMC